MKEIQIRIVKIAQVWAKTHKTPITLAIITKKLPDYKPRTIRASAETLVRKGYFRRSCAERGAVYVLIRTIL